MRAGDGPVLRIVHHPVYGSEHRGVSTERKGKKAGCDQPEKGRIKASDLREIEEEAMPRAEEGWMCTLHYRRSPQPDRVFT